jgi:hypothetical protein
MREEYMRIGFVGGGRWAPVTCRPDIEVIWHESVSQDPGAEKQWSSTWGGFSVQPGQSSLTASLEEATSALHSVLDRMIEFQAKYRPDEEFFARVFRDGQAVLLGEKSWKVNIDELFPVGIYPEESYRLLGAVEEAWMLGGMGMWNDWEASDPEVSRQMEDVTLAYVEAMGKALYAAVNVHL